MLQFDLLWFGFPFQFQSIAIDQTPRHVSQQSEADNLSEQEEEKDDTEEEFDDELDYDFNVNITPRYKTNQTRQDRRVVRCPCSCHGFFYYARLEV